MFESAGEELERVEVREPGGPCAGARESGARRTDPAMGGPVRDPVLTETAGDLYAQQGLYDRAAEVYARLLEERPDDADLREKLDRVMHAAGIVPVEEPDPAPAAEEAAVAAPAEEGAVPASADEAALAAPADEPPSAEEQPDMVASTVEPAAVPLAAPAADPAAAEPAAVAPAGEPTASDDRVLEEVEAAWTGRAGALAAEGTPYAWEEDPAAAEADSAETTGGQPVAAYFRELLGWRPTSVAGRAPTRPADSTPGARAEGSATVAPSGVGRGSGELNEVDAEGGRR